MAANRLPFGKKLTWNLIELGVDNPINTFATQARKYCSFIENNAVPNSWKFSQECLHQLLHLYQLALQLPEVEPESDDLLEDIKHETWYAIQQNIAKKLARDYYWKVFEPLEQETPEPLVGSFSDDLADIWLDLKRGVAALDSGTTTILNDVVWHWRFSFETHWGNHAASAIPALHALCFGQFADGSRPPLEPPSE